MTSHRADAHNSAQTAPAPTTTTTTPKPERVSRPSFTLEQSSEKWEYFKTRWNTYKTATSLIGDNIQIQLMEACSETLRFSMFQYDSNINTKPENEILAAMKRLLVKEENILVSRVNLHVLSQESNEPIRNWAGRVKGLAELCKFVVKCTNCDHDVRYTDHQVRDNLVRGLYDQDIQRDVFGLEDQEMALEPLMKLLEAKEVGKRTQASIRGQTAGALSSYKRNQRTSPGKPQDSARRRNNSSNNNPSPTLEIKCRYCGKTGHGKNDGPGRNTVQNRRDKCPAFQHVCNICSIKGHFSNLCLRKNTEESLTQSLQQAIQVLRG